MIADKVKYALGQGLNVIYCIGEGGAACAGWLARLLCLRGWLAGWQAACGARRRLLHQCAAARPAGLAAVFSPAGWARPPAGRLARACRVSGRQPALHRIATACVRTNKRKK